VVTNTAITVTKHDTLKENKTVQIVAKTNKKTLERNTTNMHRTHNNQLCRALLSFVSRFTTKSDLT